MGQREFVTRWGQRAWRCHRNTLTVTYITAVLTCWYLAFRGGLA